jgi:hypothetical protein
MTCYVRLIPQLSRGVAERHVAQHLSAQTGSICRFDWPAQLKAVGMD